MKQNMDSIEFYFDKRMVASAKSSMVLPVGAFINIRKKTWEVASVTFAVDDADDFARCRVRCNVDLKEP
jgi:hypothetical protein